MAEIAWTEEAQRWLKDIFEYIAADNPRAAARTVQGIWERAQMLATFPEIGHRYLASKRNVRILLYAPPASGGPGVPQGVGATHGNPEEPDSGW